MDKFLIQGGARLSGEIDVSGAKNAALPNLCASVLCAEPLYLDNIPDLQDVRTLLALLKEMGVQSAMAAGTVTIESGRIVQGIVPYERVKMMRASILVLGPLLARFGEARVSLPGGCAIGARPIDQHIAGLRAMGAEIEIQNGTIHARTRRLKGCRFVFDRITVTGTENLLMAATLAEGETVLENAAREPEVTDLATLLCAMGAQIRGIGTHRLVVQGVSQLHGARHRVIPDRIEAGTFLCAAVATQGRITLRRIQPGLLDAALEKLCTAGAKIKTGRDWIYVRMNRRPHAVSFQTAEYPAFPTDLQAQFMALDCISDGCARIVETIFENRLMHVQELSRLGARIHIHHNTALVTGIPHLSGATVTATDLRASASLVIAGLAADGATWVERIDHLDRGYDQMEIKLAALGAKVRRVDAEDTDSEVEIKRIANARAA